MMRYIEGDERMKIKCEKCKKVIWDSERLDNGKYFYIEVFEQGRNFKNEVDAAVKKLWQKEFYLCDSCVTCFKELLEALK